MTPRQLWEKWQREGRKTRGSRQPLETFLLEYAQWHAADAFVAETRGEPIPERAVEVLRGTVDDFCLLLARHPQGGDGQ